MILTYSSKPKEAGVSTGRGLALTGVGTSAVLVALEILGLGLVGTVLDLVSLSEEDDELFLCLDLVFVVFFGIFLPCSLEEESDELSLLGLELFH